MDAARAFVAKKMGATGAVSGGNPAPAAASCAPHQGVPIEPALDFVSEAEVRDALRQGKRLRVSRKALLTPSARELGEEKRVFEWI